MPFQSTTNNENTDLLILFVRAIVRGKKLPVNLLTETLYLLDLNQLTPNEGITLVLSRENQFFTEGTIQLSS